MNIPKTAHQIRKAGDDTSTNAHATSESDTPMDVPHLVSEAASKVQASDAADIERIVADAVSPLVAGLQEILLIIPPKPKLPIVIQIKEEAEKALAGATVTQQDKIASLVEALRDCLSAMDTPKLRHARESKRYVDAWKHGNAALAGATTEGNLSGERRHKKPSIEGGASTVEASGTAMPSQSFKGIPDDRPRLKNLKMLDAIHKVVIEHSGNKELADKIWSYLRFDNGKGAVAPPSHYRHLEGIPREADPWHPASEQPPKPEDLPILTSYGVRSFLAIHAWGTWENVRSRVTHWRKITPPK